MSKNKKQRRVIKDYCGSTVQLPYKGALAGAIGVREFPVQVVMSDSQLGDPMWRVAAMCFQKTGETWTAPEGGMTGYVLIKNLHGFAVLVEAGDGVVHEVWILTPTRRVAASRTKHGDGLKQAAIEHLARKGYRLCRDQAEKELRQLEKELERRFDLGRAVAENVRPATDTLH